jgi:hypothetical protein
VRIFHNIVLTILIWIVGHTKGKYLFRKWLGLENLKEKLVQSIQDESDFPQSLLNYLHTSTNIHPRWYEMGDWSKLVELFYVCITKSPQVELPITSPSNEQHKEESWEYPERTWHLYSHLLAKSYGWTLEYIANLPVIEVIAKIQEIIVDDQLDREFIYGLSEVAYHYDKNSKTSKFVPLPRPHWMRPRIQPVKKMIIPKSMMPVGNVITEGVLPPELMPREIH